MSDYIPTSDAEFSAWLNNFISYANANLTPLGLVATDLTPLQTAATAFNTAVGNNVAAQAAAKGTRESKDSARDAAEGLARPLVQRLQTAPEVKNSQRQSLGLNVRSTSRTAAAAPTSRPVATVDTRQRLQHTISFVDENTPGSRAKPDGVVGCEVWVKVGTAPADPSELTYLATDTKTPYTAVFDGADAGKAAHYMLRWVNRRGERGPWSQTVSATITA
jgi:hypothetical protein